MLYLCFVIKYCVSNIPLYDHGQKQLYSLIFFGYVIQLYIFSTIFSGFLTIGLCTVPRKGASYLSLTLSSMIGGMKIQDKKDVVIVIFLASNDRMWLEETIKNIQFTYPDEIDSGLILVVQPKQHIYPDFRYICSSGLMLYISVFNYSVALGRFPELSTYNDVTQGLC